MNLKVSCTMFQKNEDESVCSLKDVEFSGKKYEHYSMIVCYIKHIDIKIAKHHVHSHLDCSKTLSAKREHCCCCTYTFQKHFSLSFVLLLLFYPPNTFLHTFFSLSPTFFNHSTINLMSKSPFLSSQHFSPHFFFLLSYMFRPLHYKLNE